MFCERKSACLTFTTLIMLASASSGIAKGKGEYRVNSDLRARHESPDVAARRPSESNRRESARKTESPRPGKKTEQRRPKPDFNETAPGKKVPPERKTPPGEPNKPPNEKPKQEPPKPPTWIRPFKPGI